jgi:hypothetical protein
MATVIETNGRTATLPVSFVPVAHASADADRLQPILDRLAHRVVGRERRQLAAVEAVAVAGLREQRAGSRRIARVGAERERELEVAGDELPTGRDSPSVSASLSAWRSRARLAVKRAAGTHRRVTGALVGIGPFGWSATGQRPPAGRRALPEHAASSGTYLVS